MKNLKGIIGYGVGAIMAVLTLAWNAMAFFTTKLAGATESASMYDAYGKDEGKMLEAFDKLVSGACFNASRILSIVTLVVACLVAVGCVLGLLNELGVVKIKFMNYINYALAGLFVVFALLSLILMAVSCGKYNDLAAGTTSLSVGAGLIMVLISSVVSLAGILTATLNFGKKKAA